MNGDVIYHQQVSYCGKPRCRKCREGIGHGPYWYAYRTENGRTIRTYIGKQLPPDVQAAQNGVAEHIPVEADSVIIRIHVLGQFQLERKQRSGWQAVTEPSWQHQRVRSLLACLLSNSARKLGREQVMDALWPDLDFVSASGRLDKSVHSLRQLLEPSLDRPAASHLLRIERDGVVLADSTLIWVDADAFEQLLAQASTSSDASEKEQLLEEAVALYGGDFLPEEQRADWASARREILQRAWMGLLLELADLRIARGALFNAIEPLDRLLAADPASEAAVQRLMVSLAQLDRRGEALQAYTRFAAALKRAYNIAPLPETAQLYEAVKRGDIPVPASKTAQNGSHAENNGQNGDQSSAPNHRPIVRTPFGRIHQNPLIGRDSEFETLQRLLLETEQSSHAAASSRKKYSILSLETWKQPQCAVLVGEAGIGKTRLAEELGREAQQRGWTIAWSRVYAQESSVPYRQWTEVLRNAITHGLLSKQEISRQRLVFQPLSTLLPELQDILPQVTFSAPLAPEQEQLRLWEAVLALLVTISERTPLLIVLDDFHWADSSSCELFAYLTRRLHGHAIAVIGTYRDNELPPQHLLRSVLTDLQREQAIIHLPLQPLTKEQIGSLVKHLPPSVVQHIQNQASGNPFFAEELARGLDNAPGFGTTNGNHDAPTDSAQTLPDTIAAVLDLRIGRLSQPCQRLLSNAAVLGGSFEFTTIARMEASGASATDEDTVLDLIEEAIQAGVISEEGTGTRINYHFWHPLLASHLYDKLSAARRASLHRRAAAVLQHVYRNHEEEGAATITHHLVEGGSDPQTITYYAELAGNHAYALSAYPEAERYYRIAAHYIEEEETTDENESSNPQLAYLWEKLGECARYQGNYSEARALYERVLKEREYQIDIASSNEQQYEAQIKALLWIEIGWTWYSTGNLVLAQECCNHGEMLLHAADIETGPAWGNLRFQQSYIYWQEGKYDEARHMAQAALELFSEKPQRTIMPEFANAQLTAIKRTLNGDPVNVGRTHALLGAIANSLGKPTEALTHLNTALEIYEQYNRQREIANVSCNIGDAYLRKAEHSLAQSAFRRSLNLAERVGDVPLISVIFGNLGVLSARTGNLIEAEQWLSQGNILAEQINDQVYMNILLVYLAGVSQDKGNLADTRMYICRALKIGRSMRNNPCIGFALVASGKLYILQAQKARDFHSNSNFYVRRAKKILERALALEELEAETRIEGRLALAQISLLAGDFETAHRNALSMQKEAIEYEQNWLLVRVHSMLGSILAAQKQWKEADKYFQQAMHSFEEYGMRLEYARVLQNYGEMLLSFKSTGNQHYQQGIQYLQEAMHIFKERHAALDVQHIERIYHRLKPDNVPSQ